MAGPVPPWSHSRKAGTAIDAVYLVLQTGVFEDKLKGTARVIFTVILVILLMLLDRWWLRV